MKTFLKVVDWFNLIDANGHLSISNLALYVMVVKIALIPQVGLADAGVLFLALLNYGHKRYVVSKEHRQVVAMDDCGEAENMKREMASMKDAIGKLSMAVGFGAGQGGHGERS